MEDLLATTDADWQEAIDQTLMPAVRASKLAVPHMKARGGGVILMNASICAKQPLGYEPIYNVTKAGLMMFSKCLSNEVIGDNIRVNCICPGPINTGMTQAIQDEHKKIFAKRRTALPAAAMVTWVTAVVQPASE